MTRRFLAVALLGCLSTAQAVAVAVSGSFTGVAHVSAQGGGRPASSNVPVKGTFELEIPTASWNDDPGVAPPSARIEFDLDGERFQFLAGPDLSDSPGSVSVAGAPAQSVSFLTSYQPRFDGAILTFGSRDNLLFDNDDFSTLAVNTRTVSWMTASFASSRAAVAASVDVLSFRFGTLASPVGEPPLWALLLTGVAGVVLWRTFTAARRPSRSGQPRADDPSP